MILGDLILMAFTQDHKNHEVRSPKIMKNVSFNMVTFGD